MVDAVKLRAFIEYEVHEHNSQQVDDNHLRHLLSLYDGYRDNKRLQLPFDVSQPFDPRMVLFDDEVVDPANPGRNMRIEEARRAHAYLRQYYYLMVSTFGEDGKIPELRQTIWGRFKVKVERFVNNLDHKDPQAVVACYVALSALIAAGVLAALGGVAMMASGFAFGAGAVVAPVGVAMVATGIIGIGAIWKSQQTN